MEGKREERGKEGKSEMERERNREIGGYEKRKRERKEKAREMETERKTPESLCLNTLFLIFLSLAWIDRS